MVYKNHRVIRYFSSENSNSNVAFQGRKCDQIKEDDDALIMQNGNSSLRLKVVMWGGHTNGLDDTKSLEVPCTKYCIFNVG